MANETKYRLLQVELEWIATMALAAAAIGDQRMMVDAQKRLSRTENEMRKAQQEIAAALSTTKLTEAMEAVAENRRKR